MSDRAPAANAAQTVAAHPPLSVAITTIGVIAVAMVGSTISSQLVDLDIAGGLGVLTVVAALVANNFWTMQGPERFAATNAFFEHLGLVGGLAWRQRSRRTAKETVNARGDDSGCHAQGCKVGLDL